jgi:hypothetical protein
VAIDLIRQVPTADSIKLPRQLTIVSPFTQSVPGGQLAAEQLLASSPFARKMNGSSCQSGMPERVSDLTERRDTKNEVDIISSSSKASARWQGRAAHWG